MAYFYNSLDKDAVKAFIYEDLKILGIKIPKLEKIAKAGRSSLVQQKSGDAAVFGVPLALIDSVEDSNIGHIPQFLIHTRQYLSLHLHKEGIFRKTGSVARQKDLAQHFENHGGAHIEDAQVYDVTGVVKQFFRAMPEPLIPNILQDAFIQAVGLSTADSRAYSLTLLALLMPSEHLSVFRYILEMLSDVAQHSKENRMDIHNLAVCMTPNLFHTKQNSKCVQQQTTAIEISIQNVLNIGVIPPSITEKVVMLRSLEAHECGGGVGNSSMETSSNTTGSLSLRKKKRSGSLQGFVGSIRRSVEKLRTRTNRRSASVPDSLNILDDSDDFGFRPSGGRVHDPAGSQGQVTPQIMRRGQQDSQENISQLGLSHSKRRAIMNPAGLLGTPMMKINTKSQSADNVFDSPTRSTHSGDQTTVSLDSSRGGADGSRVSTPSKRRVWGGLRSPFSRRKRSMSAGPSYSPGTTAKHGRTSSKTRKLIRRLSGGKTKTPDMVGQRLAFTNDDADCLVRQRLPSAPTELCLNNQDTATPAAEVCDTPDHTNEAMMRNLKDGVHSSSHNQYVMSSTAADSAQASGSSVISRLHTMRESRRDQAPIRRRAKSADSRPLKRGRPNNVATGLSRVVVPVCTQDSVSSINSHDSMDSAHMISRPMETDAVLSRNHNTELINLSTAKLRCTNHSQSSAESTDQSNDRISDMDNHLRCSSQSQDSMDVDYVSRRGSQSSELTADDDSFDARMAMVARRHSNLYSESKQPQTGKLLTSQPNSSQSLPDQSHDSYHTDQSVARLSSHELTGSDRRVPQRSATFTAQSSSQEGQRSRRERRPPRPDNRPPRPEKSTSIRRQVSGETTNPPRNDSPTNLIQNQGNNSSIAFNKSDASIMTVLENPYRKLSVYSAPSSGEGGTVLPHSDSGVSIGGDSTKASKSSLISTDSGIMSDTSITTQQSSTTSHQGGSDNDYAVSNSMSGDSSANQRVVIGGNDAHIRSGTSLDMPPPLPNKTLTVRGAELPKITHADSLANLNEASKVKKSKQAFDPNHSERDRERVTTRPPTHRQVPVRVPTVFAKNDPRGMRYKMAADAVRRRSVQRPDDDDLTDTSLTSSPTRSPATRLRTERTSSPGGGAAGSPRTRHQHRLRTSGSSTRAAASAALARSLKTTYSPPPRKTSSVSLRQRHQQRQGVTAGSSRAAPRIPISTDLVRGIHNTTTASSQDFDDDRSILREHTPNIITTASTPPRIKPAMLPTRHTAGGLPPHPTQRKSPRSHSSTVHRLTPYSTNRPSPRSSSARSNPDYN